jgi:hypothetical protein
MKKKLIITESQLNRLKNNLTEHTDHANMVKTMLEELKNNYKIVEKYVKEGGDYKSVTMFEIAIDEEVIPAKNLFEYLKHKYDVSDDFIQQVIKDWVDNKITDNYTLSKNIPLR